MNFLKKTEKVNGTINYAVLSNIIFSFVHYIHIIRVSTPRGAVM